MPWAFLQFVPPAFDLGGGTAADRDAKSDLRVGSGARLRGGDRLGLERSRLPDLDLDPAVYPRFRGEGVLSLDLDLDRDREADLPPSDLSLLDLERETDGVRFRDLESDRDIDRSLDPERDLDRDLDFDLSF